MMKGVFISREIHPIVHPRRLFARLDPYQSHRCLIFGTGAALAREVELRAACVAQRGQWTTRNEIETSK